MELHAELKLRDGERKRFTVNCEHNLKGLMVGVSRLKDEVSATLTGLVLQEKGTSNPSQTTNQVSDEEDEDGSEDEEEGETMNNGAGDEPPVKKAKRQRS